MKPVKTELGDPVTLQQITEADFAILDAIARRFVLGVQLANTSTVALTQAEADRLIELTVTRMITAAATLGLPHHVGRTPITMLYHGLLGHEMQLRREKNEQ